MKFFLKNQCVTCAHAFRVENLVAAANLEDGGEELGVLLEAAVTDHLLARLVVRRHSQSCHKIINYFLQILSSE